MLALPARRRRRLHRRRGGGGQAARRGRAGRAAAAARRRSSRWPTGRPRRSRTRSRPRWSSGLGLKPRNAFGPLRVAVTGARCRRRCSSRWSCWAATVPWPGSPRRSSNRGGSGDGGGVTTGRVAVVLGTRPEIIKLAGVIDELGERAAVLIHTGQHYDDVALGGLPRRLGAGRARAPHRHRRPVAGRADRAGRPARLAELCESLAPAAVVVQGDTNSALAGALAANALGFRSCTSRPGCAATTARCPRSTTGCSSTTSRTCSPRRRRRRSRNLAREGISGEQVLMLRQHRGRGGPAATARARAARDAARRLRADAAGFVLATIHRPENTDDPRALARILTQLGALRLPTCCCRCTRAPRARSQAAGLERLLDPLRGHRRRSTAPTFLGLAAEAAAARLGLRRRAGGGHRPGPPAGRGAPLDRAARGLRAPRDARRDRTVWPPPRTPISTTSDAVHARSGRPCRARTATARRRPASCGRSGPVLLTA